MLKVTNFDAELLFWIIHYTIIQETTRSVTYHMHRLITAAPVVQIYI